MKSISKWALLLATATIIATSCNKETPAEPVITPPTFPESSEGDLTAGDSYTVKFTADRDWTLSLDSETASDFWIQDGDFKVPTLSGSEGEQSVEIGISEKISYEDRACDVILTMKGAEGDVSEVIATINIAAVVRTLAIYAGELDADGNFVYNSADTDEHFTYESEVASSVELSWPIGAALARPIVVESNFAWTPYESDIPEWLDLSVTTGDAGRTEIFLRAVMSAVPLEGAEATINFGAEGYIVPLTISSPNLELIWKSDFAESADFAANGLANGSDKVSGNVIVETDAKYFMIDLKKEMWSSYFDIIEGLDAVNASWLEIAQDYATDAVADGRHISITVEANQNSSSRDAYLFLIPSKVYDSADFNKNMLVGGDMGDQLGETYADYVVTHITQSEYSAVSPKASETELTLEKIEFGTAENDWFKGQAEFAYTFRTSSEMAFISEASTLIFDLAKDTTIKDYTFTSYDADIASPMEGSKDWIKPQWSGESGEFTFDVNVLLDDYNYSGFGITNPLYHEGYVFISKGYEHIAAIQIIIDPDVEIGTAFSVACVEPTDGVLFGEVVEGDALYEQYLEFIYMGTKVYSLQFNSADESAILESTQAPLMIMNMPTTGIEWLSGDDLGDNKTLIKMSKPTADQNPTAAIQYWMDFTTGMPKAIIHCIPNF